MLPTWIFWVGAYDKSDTAKSIFPPPVKPLLDDIRVIVLVYKVQSFCWVLKSTIPLAIKLLSDWKAFKWDSVRGPKYPVIISEGKLVCDINISCNILTSLEVTPFFNDELTNGQEVVYLLHKALRVSGPTKPAVYTPLAFWKFFTALLVKLPKYPVINASL